MNTAYEKILDVKISTNQNLLDKENHLTSYTRQLLDKIRYDLEKRKESTLKKLIKYTKQFPKVPIFKNYLAAWHSLNGNKEESDKIIKLTLKEHPNYLYGKLNYAEILLREEKVTDFLELIDNKLILQDAYPEREEFLIDEVVVFYLLTIQYFYLVDNDTEAEIRIELLEKIAPNHPKLSKLEIIKSKYIIRKIQQNFEKESRLKKTVIPIDNLKNIQTTILPTFYFDKEINDLYNTNFDIKYEKIAEIAALDKEKISKDIVTMLQDSMLRFQYFLDLEKETGYDENLFTFPLHTLFFVGYFKINDAFPVILEILQQANEYIEFWFGFEIGEYLPMVLNELNFSREECVNFIKKPNIEGFNKAYLSGALFNRYKKENTPREEIIKEQTEIIDFLLQNKENETIVDTQFSGAYITDITNFGLYELLPNIKQLFDAQIVGFWICGKYDSILKNIHNPNPSNTPLFSFENYYRKNLKNNSSFELENKSEFNLSNNKSSYKTDSTPSMPIINKIKVGRNEPCPCGSEKKYKKCCLNS